MAVEPRELIRRRAAALGFPPEIALAVATQESGAGANVYGDVDDPFDGVDPRAVRGPDGRWYHSLGPFQENVAGGAGETHLRKGGRLEDLFDPESSTDRFVDRYRWAEGTAFMGETPGEIAARAQRPYDAKGYAASVNALITSMGGAAPTTNADECPPGHYRNVFGQCVKGDGGFVPGAGSPGGDPRGELPTAPGAGKPLTGDRPWQQALTEEIANLRSGAAELATAAAIVLLVVALIFAGGRKVLG